MPASLNIRSDPLRIWYRTWGNSTILSSLDTRRRSEPVRLSGTEISGSKIMYGSSVGQFGWSVFCGPVLVLGMSKSFAGESGMMTGRFRWSRVTRVPACARRSTGGVGSGKGVDCQDFTADGPASWSGSAMELFRSILDGTPFLKYASLCAANQLTSPFCNDPLSCLGCWGRVAAV